MKSPYEHLYDAGETSGLVDEDSRYAGIPIETHFLEDGTPFHVLQRRILPPLPRAGELAKRTIRAEERLDLLAHDVYGDPRLFWQLADLNPVLHPEALVEQPGREVGVPTAGIQLFQ